MRAISKAILAQTILLFFFTCGWTLAADGSVSSSPNGIDLPKGFRNWRLIGVSHRVDNQSLRAILGNHIAISAARKGRTDPWPDGSILAKIVWKDRIHENWKDATVPGGLVHAEFMVKDKKRFGRTGSWGFARWKGEQLEPYGDNASFAQECFQCHGAAKQTDHVFTRPVQIP